MRPEDSYAVVVAAYGKSPFLEACLESLTQQTLRPALFVSTATPSAFIEELTERYGAGLLVNDASPGIASDWNFALRATGLPLVTIAHQDDVYFPRFCEATMAALTASPGASLCFTSYREIDDDGRPKQSKISLVKGLIEAATIGSATQVSGRRLLAYLSWGNPLPCSSVTFDLRKLPDFSFSSELLSNLDWKAWLDLCEAGVTFARAPERLVGRRHNALTETAKLIKSGRRRDEDLALFRRLWPRPVADLLAFVYRAGY